jgi:hypothetical protein
MVYGTVIRDLITKKVIFGGGNIYGKSTLISPTATTRNRKPARKEAEEVFGGLRELIKDDSIYLWYIELIQQYALSKIITPK